VFAGHGGMHQMTESTSQMSSDLQFEVLSLVCDGRTFAFESIGRGTNTVALGPVPATGRSFEFRLASVDDVCEQGLVTAQRDYWDLAGLLAQLGATDQDHVREVSPNPMTRSHESRGREHRMSASAKSPRTLLGVMHLLPGFRGRSGRHNTRPSRRFEAVPARSSGAGCHGLAGHATGVPHTIAPRQG
jgi:predicted ester cyclase